MKAFVSLIPAVALSLYFILGLALFAFRARRWGFPVDAETARRPASRLLGRYLRHYLMWMLSPWEGALVRLGVTPNAITFASLVTATAAAVALAMGHFALGGWLYLGTGILDIFDGRVARATGKVTTGGAFFDSVMDRYAELIVFGGLTFFYRASVPALGIVLLAALGSVMVSYTRARGEALGVNVNVGTMQRPERLFYLGMVTAMSPLVEAFVPVLRGFVPHVLVVVSLLLLGLSANVTAARRILHTLAALAQRDRERDQREPQRPVVALRRKQSL